MWVTQTSPNCSTISLSRREALRKILLCFGSLEALAALFSLPSSMKVVRYFDTYALLLSNSSFSCLCLVEISCIPLLVFVG